MEHDLGGRNVLVSDHFFYFGRDGIEVPEDLRMLIGRRARKSRFSEATIHRFLEFVPINESAGFAQTRSIPRYCDLPSWAGRARSIPEFLPDRLREYRVHADPEFETFTYGEIRVFLGCPGLELSTDGGGDLIRVEMLADSVPDEVSGLAPRTSGETRSSSRFMASASHMNSTRERESREGFSRPSRTALNDSRQPFEVTSKTSHQSGTSFAAFDK